MLIESPTHSIFTLFLPHPCCKNLSNSWMTEGKETNFMSCRSSAMILGHYQLKLAINANQFKSNEIKEITDFYYTEVNPYFKLPSFFHPLNESGS